MTGKKRERLAIEAFVRAHKQKGRPLVFTLDDVVEFHKNMKLPRRPLTKAMQNIIYVKAGILRGAEVGQYVVNSDSIGWLREDVPYVSMVGAPTGAVRRRTTSSPSRVAAAVKKPSASARLDRDKVCAIFTAHIKEAMLGPPVDLLRLAREVLAAE